MNLGNIQLKILEDLDPDENDGYILVSYHLESSLSGVMKNLTSNEVIYYKKNSDNSLIMGRKTYLVKFRSVN